MKSNIEYVFHDFLNLVVLSHMKKLGRLAAAEIPQLGESIASLAQPFEIAHAPRHAARQEVGLTWTAKGKFHGFGAGVDFRGTFAAQGADKGAPS